MSDERPPPAPPPGAYGPGKTVLAQPVHLDEGGAGGNIPFAPTEPVPPPDAFHAPAPYPLVVPPPPPRGRARRGGGPSLLVIGGIATVVIGGAATFVAIETQAVSDDKPAPTFNVPTAATVAADPTGVAVSHPSDVPTAPPAPPPRRADPSRPRPGRPGATSRPGGGAPGASAPRQAPAPTPTQRRGY